MVEMDQSKDVGAAAAEEPSSTTRTPELRMSTSVKSNSSVSNGSSSTRGSSATTATADICIARSLSQDYGWTDWEDEDEAATTAATTEEQLQNKHANNNNTYSSANRSLPIVNKDDSGSAVAAVASSTPDQTSTTQPRTSSEGLLESPVDAKEEAIRIRSSSSSSHQEQPQQQQPADTGDAATQRQSLLLSSSNSNVSFGSSMMLLEPSSLPAQLHPAVSLGMRRMSSCYFSLGSSSPDLLLSADDPSHSGGGGGGGEGASIGMSHPASVADLLSLLEDESQQQLEESSERTLRQESFRTASPWTNTENNKKDDENDTDENTNNQTSDKKQNVNGTNTNSSYWNSAAAAAVAYTSSSSDLLYHDILMNVFTYLDAKSLAAFSETARRPNFECFYFLQLQLQRALVVVPPPASSSDATTTVDTTTTRSEQHHHHDPLLSAIAGVGALNRLAALDPARAAAIVQEFLNSNSTLRVMPLSHSLAYFRQVLRRHYPAVLLLKNRTTSSLGGGGGASANNAHNSNNNSSSSSMAARAALLITVVGAASSLMSGSASGAEADVMAYMNDCFQSSPFGTELPNMLFSVGFVGSLVGAARTMSSELQQQQQQQQQNTQGNDNDDNGETTTTSAAALRNSHLTMRQRAEIALHKAYCAAYGYSTGSSSTSHKDKDDGTSATPGTTTTASPRSWSSLSSSPRSNASDAAAALVLDDLSPQTPNPYEHLAPVHESPEAEDENSSDQQKQQQQLQQPKRAAPPERKLPSGCIGAYSRAVASATRAVTNILKERRQKAYEALPPEEQRQVSQTFIDACTSDDNLDVVKDLIQGQEVIHVDGFYIGADGTESCALHCSSFHGSTAILEYLCRGLDNNHDESTCHHEPNDGGLAVLDQADDNGWTALHFAAGANSVEAVRILAEHGANLSIEAVNGYTPLQWAVRLHNQAAADELRRQAALRAAGSKNNSTPNWMTLRNQPLSKICHSFLDALVPSH